MKTSSFRLVLLLTGLAAGALSAAAVTFTRDTSIGLNDTNYEGREVVVTNCRVTIDGAHAFASLQVLNGGTLTHSAGSNWAGLALVVTNDVLVEPGGAINVTGRGYEGGTGPGAGGNAGTPLSGGGGGYGGYGGSSSSNAPGGKAYGLILQPMEKGSGGGIGFEGSGGAGGGAVKLSIGGALRVNGGIYANGSNAFSGRSGGGAGGSIWVTAQTLAGNGLLSADGGAGEPPYGGGGGGGRIALYYQTSTFTGSLSARGGRGAVSGGAGTLYTKLAGQPAGNLVVDNGGRSGTNTLLVAAEPFNVTARGGAALSLLSPQTIGGLLLVSNGWLNMGNPARSPTALTISGEATIQAGGGIVADGAGYAGGEGPGAGGTTVANGAPAGSGGGYGGFGAASGTGALGGLAYGSVTQPADQGSGGGPGYGSALLAGAGGGAILLNVSGTLRVDGKLSADGTPGSGQGSGGGAGGSIRVNAGTLAGSGIISASGGLGNELGGGGGGGRIALYYGLDNFSGTIKAWGAGRGTNFGGAGTIYTRVTGQNVGQVVLDNGGRSSAATMLAASDSIGLAVQGGAVYTPSGSQTLASLVVGPNSWIRLADTDYSLTVAGNATIQAGGGIVADGAGSPGGTGSGAGRSTPYAIPGDGTIYTGGGGGHGGYGASSSFGAAGGAVYGALASPQSTGSGGGAGAGSDGSSGSFGGAGGGSIRLSVGGTLALDGRISADGAPGVGAHSGGGSGGSVWLAAGTLSGSGLISASGGAGNGFGGGGGGGRIAISYQKNSSFSGITRAFGGGGSNGTNSGGAGTIYIQLPYPSAPQLVIDNGGAAGTNTALDATIPTADLTVRGGASYVSAYPSAYATLSVGNLFVGSNSWILFNNGDSTVTVGGNATIEAGGGIKVDGKGLTSGFGNGAGRSAFSVGGGGGYGGCGGSGGVPAAYGGTAYGYASQALGQGSGGGVGGGAGGAGGGFLRLSATGIVVLEGTLSANGLPGVGTNSGGGSGGGIWISTAALLGSGTICANGGAGNGLGGGGGGGRILLQPTADLFSGLATTYGGAGFVRGGAGTLFTSRSGQTPGLLVADNGGMPGTNTILIDTNSFDLTVSGGAVALLPGSSSSLRDLLISSNGWLATPFAATPLNVTGNAIIQAGGGISADGAGYPAGQGSGAGYSSSTAVNGGGSYGGLGGANPSSYYVATYGSATAPNVPGSGGGGGSKGVPPWGGAGGGVVVLKVTGSLDLEGRISANGLAGGANRGGGSGGSIWITAGTLLGAGAISADGGAGSNAGGGGGGRVALNCGANFFKGLVSAYGGGGCAWGGAGTVFTSSKNQGSGKLVLDNAGRSGANTTLGSSYLTYTDLLLRNGARLALSDGGEFPSMTILSNSWLVLGRQAGILSVSGTVTVQAGGGILADGTGSPAMQGQGGGASGSSAYGTTGGGGAHGGFGGASATGIAGGNCFDSVTAPALPGGGGGNGLGYSPDNRGGTGGGVITLYCGTLQLDGVISAGGEAGYGEGSGGGAGGSINLSVTTLSGAGRIAADGGFGNGLGGGGGGGRVALTCAANYFTGDITAWGGGGGAWGGAGTLYTKLRSQPRGLVLVDNGGQFGTNTSVASSTLVDLTIQSGGSVSPTTSFSVWSNLTINPGGTLTGSAATAPTNLELVVLGNALIEAGGALEADGQGCRLGTGPGAGRSAYALGSGAGHGGLGGASSVLPGGATYGSVQQPADLGSGGGSGWGQGTTGSEGGGALRLNVAGKLTVNGSISAQGNPGSADDAGGGSGGSIWVTANGLAGTGRISADGGPGELFEGGGGGGGRIALYARTNTFAGQCSAAGAEGFYPGEDGSVYFSSAFERLAVVSQTPVGVLSNGVSSIDLDFNTPFNPYSVSSSAASLVTPVGQLSGLSVSAPKLGRLHISFPLQTTPGEYTLTVGQQLKDLSGQPMSQVYTGAFTLSLPVVQGTIRDTNGLPVAGVQLVVNGAFSPITTDTHGSYTLGVPPGTDAVVSPYTGDRLFVPGTRLYTNVTASVSNQNYLAVADITPAVAAQAQPGGIALNWQGIAGVAYQAVCSTNLVDWLSYGEVMLGTNGPLKCVIPTGAEPVKFFRLRANN